MSSDPSSDPSSTMSAGCGSAAAAGGGAVAACRSGGSVLARVSECTSGTVATNSGWLVSADSSARPSRPLSSTGRAGSGAGATGGGLAPGRLGRPGRLGSKSRSAALGRPGTRPRRPAAAGAGVTTLPGRARAGTTAGGAASMASAWVTRACGPNADASSAASACTHRSNVSQACWLKACSAASLAPSGAASLAL